MAGIKNNDSLLNHSFVRIKMKENYLLTSGAGLERLNLFISVQDMDSMSVLYSNQRESMLNL